MLEFSVENQKLNRIDLFTAASDSKEYLKVFFDFRTDDWDGYTKAAIFKNDKGAYTVPLDENNAATIPEISLTESYINISVFGILNNVRITTNETRVLLKQSGYVEGETPPEPPQSVYESILEKCNTAVATAEKVQERADNGEFKGDKGDKGDTYTLTDKDKADIAEIVKVECFDEVEAAIDNSGVLDI